MNNDITIVTAFFDIGRGNLPMSLRGKTISVPQQRNIDVYFYWFNYLAQLKNDMVIYTTPNFVERILKARIQHGLVKLTKIIEINSYLPNQFVSIRQKIKEIMDSPIYYEKLKNPEPLEFWNPDYTLLTILKFLYVSNAIDNGFTKNDLVAWIDFGYCRSQETLPKSLKWSYPFNKNKIHCFHMQPIDPNRSINDVIYNADLYFQACHIIAGNLLWKKFLTLILNNLNLLMKNNLIDDEQTLMLMSYLNNPELFELRLNRESDYNIGEWFTVFKLWNENL